MGRSVLAATLVVMALLTVQLSAEMFIGFTSNFQRVSEADAREGQDYFAVQVFIMSPITSETSYTVPVRVQEMRNATVIAQNDIGVAPFWDAAFGYRQTGDQIQQLNNLVAGDTYFYLLPTINDDFNIEDNNKCFTLQIDKPDVIGAIFECDAVVDGTQYYCSHTMCIDDDDEPFLVRFVETVYTITEGEGDVKVCVSLTTLKDIFDNFVGVEVFRNDTSLYVPSGVVLATPDRARLGVYPMVECTDYQEQRSGRNAIINEQITELMRVVCYNQVIYNDLRLESREWLGLTLEVQEVPFFTSARTDIERFFGDAAIQIIDNDVARVGLEMTFYQVTETDGFVEICAVVFEPDIVCPIEFDFDVSLSTCDGSAMSTMDYGEEMETILMFRSCETRACTNVAIVDDNVAELTERFSVKLHRTDGLDPRITLDPVVAVVEIMDTYPVENFKILSSSETTLSFSWTQSRIVPSRYTLTCSSLLEGIPSPDPLLIVPTATTATVTGLLSGVTYSCDIITHTSEKSSQPRTLNSTTVETIPAGAPEMFVTAAGERQVTFSWSPPPVALRNGVITSYALSCSPSPSSLPQSPSQPGPLSVAGFSPNTSYSCYVVARNSQGSGPPANISFTTQQDYMYFQLRLDSLVPCTEFINIEKLEDITNAVLQELTDSCAECGISSDIISRQSFACFTDSPTHVTFRARLGGSSETDSGSLVSLLQRWVSDGATIIVTGVLMTVDAECSVAISSLSEEECIPDPATTSSSSSSTAAIIGGVVAVVLVIALTVFGIAAVVILKRRRSKFSTSNAKEHALGPLPLASDVVITTSTNTAYEMMKHEAHQYGPLGAPPVDAQYEVPSPPAPQQPAAVCSGGGTEGEEDVMYEEIPGDQ